MPSGRAFEAYHLTDTTVQPKIIHSHEFYEIYFFLRGRIRIVIEDVDICPQRGDVLVFPPHCMHRNIHISADEPYERFYLYASRETVESICNGSFQLAEELDELLRSNGFLFHLNDPALEELMQLTDEIISASEQQAPSDCLMNQYRMCMLLIRTTMLLQSCTTEESGIQSRMNPLLRYLNEHITEPISLDHLADTFFLSKFALLREFKEHTGMSIHQYILAKRILLAQELLAQGIKPNQVGERCGFLDYTSFYRAFRNRTGVSPNQYGRQNHR
ncbi:MAG: helix-turn-helix domain-containing protein [Clostridia bacterium]|nr:helix-turn-helix domain-containing protein [Clostridia bacterium]